MFSLRPWWALVRDRGDEAGRRRFLVIATLVVAIVVGAGSLTAPWRLADARIYDYLSTLVLPAVPADAPIIVAIDEPSFAEIGRQWPWPRDLHARLVEALRAAGAKAIGLDIIFAEPSSPQADAALAAALGADVVLAADETLIETPHAVQHVRVDPLKMFTDRGAIAGVASIVLDGDVVMRRIPTYQDGFARRLFAVAGSDPPTVPEGAQIRVFGPARALETVSYYQALNPHEFLPTGTFEGRTVIVGLSMQSAPSVDSGGADAYATPFTVRSRRLVSGAEIHGTIHANLSAGLAVAPAGRLLGGAALLVALAAAMFTVWRGTGWRTLVAAFGAVAVAFAGGFALLHLAGVHVPPLAPSLAFVLVAASQGARDYAAERRMRRGITRAFSQYLSPVMVERLARDPSLLKLGGERKTLTILFSDIRGFTTIAESMKGRPEDLTVLINRLLTPLSDVVLAAGGTIDKYMGDCVMAFWNAPLDDPDHAFHAVETGLRMLDELDRLNAQLAEEARAGLLPEVSLSVGVGINTGDVVVGNMGSQRRFDYSVLGDAVNLASRLEGETRNAGVPILLGAETARLVGDRIPLRGLGKVTVKGKLEPVEIFTVDRGVDRGPVTR